jgi:hypothetical protein
MVGNRFSFNEKMGKTALRLKVVAALVPKRTIAPVKALGHVKIKSVSFV